MITHRKVNPKQQEILANWVKEPPRPIVHQQILVSKHINRNQYTLEVWLTLAPEDNKNRMLMVGVYILNQTKYVRLWVGSVFDPALAKRDDQAVVSALLDAHKLLDNCRTALKRSTIETESKITLSQFNKFASDITQISAEYLLLAKIKQELINQKSIGGDNGIDANR